VLIFTSIDAGRGAGLLARLPREEIQHLMSHLAPSLAREYDELMQYPPECAGSLMDPEVTTFRGDETVEEALAHIRSLPERRILDVCIVDAEGILTAVITLQEIAVSPLSKRLNEIEVRQPVAVQGMDPREDVVKLLEERKLASLPVVDIDGRLQGIIRHDALVTAAKQEATEDVQAMFGAGRDERALSPARLAVRKRLPWLEINLATAFLASAVVGLFESTIAQITALAVFLPVVAGQSGNTGSQALAVALRGLALREIRTRHWFKLVRKEAMVGFVNGCVVAITTSLVVYIWSATKGEASIGLPMVIGCSMVFSMVIAGVAGAIIPVALKSLGQDPAQSSSIVLTTVTDVVGFFSFLGLATMLFQYLV
jgi:magnesium transporter